MEKAILILSITFSLWSNAQTTDDYDFELHFKLRVGDISNCFYDFKKIEKDSTKLSFYLIDRHINRARLSIENGKYKIIGNFTTLIGAREILPILLIMVEPIYITQETCNNRINTYFIDLNSVKFDDRIFSIDMGTLKLGEKKYMKVLESSGSIKINYDWFMPPELNHRLEFSLDNWYRI